jgi:hypothetical protein
LGAADFLVHQFAGAEQRAFAHHHAHEQRARSLRQAMEGGEEVALVLRQQVVVALAYPAQHQFEVVEVIEGIVEHAVHDGR